MEKTSHWLNILANVGLIAGLILVAIQISQNTATIKGSAYQTWVAANLELNVAAAEENLSATIGFGSVDSSNLSEETYIEFALWNYSLFQLIQATDYLYQTGSLDHALWKSEIDRAAIHLRLPGVRQWWDAGGKTQLTPHFVELIESTDPSSNRWAWKEGIGFVPDDRWEE